LRYSRDYADIFPQTPIDADGTSSGSREMMHCDVVPLTEVLFRARRAGQFARLVGRFDLIPLGKIADWLAREPGRVDRNEQRRRQALDDLRESITDGQFGAPDKPVVVYMPKVPLRRRPLRVNAVQIEMCQAWGSDIVNDLWVPRALAVRWLTGRQVPLFPWLAPTKPVHREGDIRRLVKDYLVEGPRNMDLVWAFVRDRFCESTREQVRDIYRNETGRDVNNRGRPRKRG
jgi:hypothetical protein